MSKRPFLAIALFFVGLAAYGLLSKLAGPDPHAVRALVWDYAAVFASSLLVAGAALGCFHVAGLALSAEAAEETSGTSVEAPATSFRLIAGEGTTRIRRTAA